MSKDKILGKEQIEKFYTIIYPPRIIKVGIQPRHRNFIYQKSSSMELGSSLVSKVGREKNIRQGYEYLKYIR